MEWKYGKITQIGRGHFLVRVVRPHTISNQTRKQFLAGQWVFHRFAILHEWKSTERQTNNERINQMLLHTHFELLAIFACFLLYYACFKAISLLFWLAVSPSLSLSRCIAHLLLHPGSLPLIRLLLLSLGEGDSPLSSSPFFIFYLFSLAWFVTLSSHLSALNLLRSQFPICHVE